MSIGWIDFSPSHRDKIGAALDLLRPEGMVDELGMATLRDALANHMFPGIGTVQTRAKYFFIIPYILQEYQQMINEGKARGKSASKYLDQREHELMWKLVDKYSILEEGATGRDSQGVIGIRRPKPRRIVRRPSAIYWNGIGYYNFVKTHQLPLEVFLKKDSKGEFESLLSAISDSDEPRDDADADHENLFHIRVPAFPGWDEELTLELTVDEAEFFQDRILTYAKGKLIAELLKNEKLWDIFYASENFMKFAKAAVYILPDGALRSELILAHDFSQLMFGAHLAYNCVVDKLAFEGDRWEEEWMEWRSSLRDEMIDYAGFDLEKLFTYTSRTKPATIRFVKDWWSLMNMEQMDFELRNQLVESQEFHVKPGKARIKYQKFDEVTSGEWVGLSFFNYRFGNAKRILHDIKKSIS
jgi:hypothetical protein